ncbi:MAG: hypothetical protein Q8P49_02805 [Candidatus Liptonbacteria bacterium]|nr:hypothetical protein [Candidatus Liptonbacteria bacterium]
MGESVLVVRLMLLLFFLAVLAVCMALAIAVYKFFNFLSSISLDDPSGETTGDEKIPAVWGKYEEMSRMLDDLGKSKDTPLDLLLDLHAVCEAIDTEYCATHSSYLSPLLTVRLEKIIRSRCRTARK